MIDPANFELYAKIAEDGVDEMVSLLSQGEKFQARELGVTLGIRLAAARREITEASGAAHAP